jgi:hypothetical protein
MPDTNRNQSESPLVRSVNALDANFFELIRLGNKIDEINLKSDTDYEQLERLLKRFAEYGDGVSSQIVLMSQALTDSRAQAEAVAQAVSIKAALLHERKVAEQSRRAKKNGTVSFARRKSSRAQFITDGVQRT